MFSSYAQSQVVVWSDGKAIYNSKDEKVDSVSFLKLSKAGSSSIPTTNTDPVYKEVKPTYNRESYSVFCNVILGSASEGETGFTPGVSDDNFRWVEIYDASGKLIESTNVHTTVYQVPHFGWIIPYFQYSLSASSIGHQKIAVGTLDKLKISFIYRKMNFFME